MKSLKKRNEKNILIDEVVQKNLRELFDRMDITYNDAARIMGISPNMAIYSLTRRGAKLPGSVLYRVSRATGVDVDYFFQNIEKGEEK